MKNWAVKFGLKSGMAIREDEPANEKEKNEAFESFDPDTLNC